MSLRLNLLDSDRMSKDPLTKSKTGRFNDTSFILAKIHSKSDSE